MFADIPSKERENVKSANHPNSPFSQHWEKGELGDEGNLERVLDRGSQI